MTGKSLTAAICLILGTSAWVTAGSLGDAARREQERRKKLEDGGKAPSRVITQDDLLSSERKPAQSLGTPAQATDASARRPLAFIAGPAARGRDREASAPSPAVREARSTQESDWRRRAATARAAVESAQWEYDSTHKPSVWSNGGFHGDTPTEKRKQNEAKARLDAARQAQADLEEEARRAGIPPEWLR
jgi:hypothetical protein